MTSRSISIFGPNFKSSHKYANTIVEMMIKKDILSVNGMIKQEKSPLVDKSGLWGYCFYIWYTNQDKFERIKNHISYRTEIKQYVVQFLKHTLNKTNLRKYVKEDRDELIYLTKAHLILFIHSLVLRPNITIPVLKVLQGHEPKELIDRLIDEEEKKYRTLLRQLEKSVLHPKVTIVEDSSTIALTLRNK